MAVARQFGRILRAAVSQRSMSSSAAAVEVCFLDPRTLLQRTGLKELLADPKQYTVLKVPEALLPGLSQGRMELGDMDDPMNMLYFGEADELFKYRLIGTHPTMSGFTSVIEKRQFESLCETGGDAGLPDWEDFKADLLEGRVSFPSVRVPLLFAGSVLDAPAAAVYQLKRDGEVVGVAVSSEAAE